MIWVPTAVLRRAGRNRTAARPLAVSFPVVAYENETFSDSNNFSIVTYCWHGTHFYPRIFLFEAILE